MTPRRRPPYIDHVIRGNLEILNLIAGIPGLAVDPLSGLVEYRLIYTLLWLKRSYRYDFCISRLHQ